LRDKDEDIFVFFRADNDLPEVRIVLTAEGEDNEIFVVRSGTTPPSNRSLDELHAVCNQWNAKRRWPKAFVYENEQNPDDRVVFLENQLDLKQGVHRGLFDSFIDGTFGGIFEFIRWFHDEANWPRQS
jgi:hypothetical protein